ncbi:hypothetical protein KY319_01720 [Candidatus Woesearchaeota archaeon]|nr:hypothetical protein [Candidatus Woesearchaeota archaeon]
MQTIKEEKMNKSSIAFLILAVAALLLAGFLTWNLAYPKQAEQFYEYSFGISPKEPSQQAIGKGTIKFQKTED